MLSRMPKKSAHGWFEESVPETRHSVGGNEVSAFGLLWSLCHRGDAAAMIQTWSRDHVNRKIGVCTSNIAEPLICQYALIDVVEHLVISLGSVFRLVLEAS